MTLQVLFFHICLHQKICSQKKKDIVKVSTEWLRLVIQTHFLWLSVSVMPCEDTLKCTMVAVGEEAAASVSDMALATA